MRGRDLLVACVALMSACGVLTACSSDDPAPPAPRPSGIAEIKPCDFFTQDELDEYELHDPGPLTSPLVGCMWQGSKFFEDASTVLVLTLQDRSADAESVALGSSSGERISERKAVNGRRVWRDTTPGKDVTCGLIFEIDGSSSAELKLSEFLGVSDAEPTQQDLCKGLDELAPRVEEKLPAVRT
ncbi:DUF3558 family protein [Streptomyces atratus]|uniref:DUF3558 domain-containing protein n=1 Tax=Streptomyces atratus TaxID=1893 RepID=A0A1K1W168_STRAR|nr:DUF3558 family protein [Streptomyces atratus]SFX31177.1 Protein of unknown function [Streptomyces atratus]